MKKPTAHEKYAEKIRAEGRSATPYRLGLAVGAAGDNLPSPYKPGSRGDHSYLDGLEYGRAEKKINAKARQLYETSTANDSTVHCNRFPSWDELTGAAKWPWREKAIEALANPCGVKACVPTGYKLVPIKPTPEMLTAGRDAPDHAWGKWDAMVNAAPDAAGVALGDPAKRDDEAFRQFQRDRIEEARKHDAEQAKPKLTDGVGEVGRG